MAESRTVVTNRPFTISTVVLSRHAYINARHVIGRSAEEYVGRLTGPTMRIRSDEESCCLSTTSVTSTPGRDWRSAAGVEAAIADDSTSARRDTNRVSMPVRGDCASAARVNTSASNAEILSMMSLVSASFQL